MSGLSDFLTQGSYWWGVISGAVVTAGGGALSLRASDKRKAAQEDKVQGRKEEHEKQLDADRAARDAKIRSDQLTRERAGEFVAVCTDIFNKSADIEGVFNLLRDQFYNNADLPDPKADDKFAYAQEQAESTMRISDSYNQLRLVASKPIMDRAMDLNLAAMTVLKAITNPLAKGHMQQQFGKALDDFVEAVRAELGLDPYGAEEAQRETASFMENLKKQVDEYLDEARRDMSEGRVHNPYGSSTRRTRPQS
ncbi:hypothetical protein BJF87_21435 [Gordonia sp. CNJ-863]|uniref:hypothetical protein n=1 Tax=Gordonia sp. CNJ-863 TaxID=1904963 RepID=UPI00095E1D9E|nr:hypothetical protein [Gordonia sp. CNJ-863]OLT47781.1 hypothetical protein BJF87_21435 [Gordonia sp. CNJ-863]